MIHSVCASVGCNYAFDERLCRNSQNDRKLSILPCQLRSAMYLWMQKSR
jgi:hypothetical protein